MVIFNRFAFSSHWFYRFSIDCTLCIHARVIDEMPRYIQFRAKIKAEDGIWARQPGRSSDHAGCIPHRSAFPAFPRTRECACAECGGSRRACRQERKGQRRRSKHDFGAWTGLIVKINNGPLPCSQGALKRERGGLIYSLHGAEREEDNLLASSPREIGATFQRDDSTNDVVFKEMIISSGLINCRHAPPSLFRDRKSRVMFGGVYSNEQLGRRHCRRALSLSDCQRDDPVFVLRRSNSPTQNLFWPPIA